MTEPLPVHDDFSLARRAFSVTSILTATSLTIAGVVRLVTATNGPQWWWLVPLVAGMLAADFLSGLVHWTADTWGSESMPVIGRRLLHPFRVHHVNPDDFLRRRFVDTNGDVAFVVIPVALLGVLLPLDHFWQRGLALFLIAFCGIGLLTNQVHQWAHMTHPPAPIHLLQRIGVLLSYEAHQLHHESPHEVNYCIATGWCNRPLEAIGFFRRLESMVTRLTGIRPRHDEEAFFTQVKSSLSNSDSSH